MQTSISLLAVTAMRVGEFVPADAANEYRSLTQDPPACLSSALRAGLIDTWEATCLLFPMVEGHSSAVHAASPYDFDPA